MFRITTLEAALLAALLASAAAPCYAAAAQVSDAAIFAARAAVDPGSCDMKPGGGSGFEIRRYKLSHATLIEVPCRLTVNSVMSIFFTENEGVLSPLPFAVAALDYRHDRNNRIDWKKARIAGFIGVMELPDAEVDAKAGVIYSSFRLAPGDADGTVLSVYRLSDDTLARVDVNISGIRKPVRSFTWRPVTRH